MQYRVDVYDNGSVAVISDLPRAQISGSSINGNSVLSQSITEEQFAIVHEHLPSSLTYDFNTQSLMDGDTVVLNFS